MTGAPKVKAMEIIEGLEPVRRGWYAGSVGYLDCRGNMDLSVVIRTAIVADGRVMLQLGGGIVADSEPAAEWAETVAKGLRIVETMQRGAAEKALAGNHGHDRSPQRGRRARLFPGGHSAEEHSRG
jgi:para-aminobenzoate synthetase component 1